MEFKIETTLEAIRAFLLTKKITLAFALGGAFCGQFLSPYGWIATVVFGAVTLFGFVEMATIPAWTKLRERRQVAATKAALNSRIKEVKEQWPTWDPARQTFLGIVYYTGSYRLCPPEEWHNRPWLLELGSEGWIEYRSSPSRSYIVLTDEARLFFKAHIDFTEEFLGMVEGDPEVAIRMVCRYRRAFLKRTEHEEYFIFRDDPNSS
jgi:hypothetical protein